MIYLAYDELQWVNEWVIESKKIPMYSLRDNVLAQIQHFVTKITLSSIILYIVCLGSNL